MTCPGNSISSTITQKAKCCKKINSVFAFKGRLDNPIHALSRLRIVYNDSPQQIMKSDFIHHMTYEYDPHSSRSASSGCMPNYTDQFTARELVEG